MRISYYFRPIVIFSFIWILLIYFLSDLLIKKLPIDKEKKIFCGKVKSYPTRGLYDYYFYLKLSDQTIVVLSREKPYLSLYEEVCVRGDVEEIRSFDYFGSFSWKRYMNMKNIFWQIKSTEIERIKSFPFFHFISKIRYGFIEVVERNFSKDVSGVVLGLVIGEKAKISKDLKDAINRCGIDHLMVASGSNISYFIGILIVIFSFFGFKRRATYLISLIFGFMYVVMIGFDPPITRAYAMMLFAFIFYSMRRNVDPIQVLFLVFLLVSFINPLYLYDPSFIMSFLGVYGILVGFMNWGWLVTKIRPFNVSPNDSDFVMFFKRKVNDVTMLSFSIFLMTVFSQAAILPYTITHFYKLSMVSIFSNIVLVPFSSFIITSSLAWLSLSFFMDASYLSFIIDHLVGLFIKIVYFFSSFKYAVFYFSPYSLFNEIAIVLFLLFLFHLPSIDFSTATSKVISSMIIFIFFSSFFWRESIKEDIVLETRGKRTWFIERNSFYYLIDPSIDLNKIINAVYASRRNRIDYVLISSYSGYNKDILDRIVSVFNVKSIYLPLWLCDENIERSVCVFGGEKGEGFSVGFGDKYGYFNVYSSVKFCFEDRCF